MRFTGYFSPDMVFNLPVQSSESAGIGVLIAPHPEGLEIKRSAQPNGPADLADIRQNDIITHVNGRNLKLPQRILAQIATLAGRAGGSITMRLLRAKRLSKTVRRENQTLNDFGEPSLNRWSCLYPLNGF